MKTAKVKVFANSEGQFGDLVPIIIDEGKTIPIEDRVEIASDLEAAETAFVNDLKCNDISIIHSQGEIPFAGTVAIGIAWYLSNLKQRSISLMKGKNGTIEVSMEGGLTWIQADLSSMPDWNFKQLESQAEIEAMDVSTTRDVEHTMYWVWIDETKGLIRARTFAADWDIPEAEANGSGAMMLAAKLGRELQMIQGQGSEVYAKPQGEHAALGGRVVETA